MNPTMPGFTFSDARVEILSGVIEDYQKITGKDKVTERTDFIAALAKKITSPEELKDMKFLQNIDIVSMSRIDLSRS